MNRKSRPGRRAPLKDDRSEAETVTRASVHHRRGVVHEPDKHVMNIRDIYLTVTFGRVQLDELDEPVHGYHVQPVDLEVWGERDLEDEGDQEDRLLGRLECFLFDVVSAGNDDRVSLFEESDHDGESMEFFEFIFNESETIRGRLLHRIDPDRYNEDDDDATLENSNVLCVSGGWWMCTPDVLVHVLARAAKLIRFDFACIDSACIRLKQSDNWRQVRPPNDSGMVLPKPFIKVVWKELSPADQLTTPDRWFYFGEVPNAVEISEDVSVLGSSP